MHGQSRGNAFRGGIVAVLLFAVVLGLIGCGNQSRPEPARYTGPAYRPQAGTAFAAPSAGQPFVVGTPAAPSPAPTPSPALPAAPAWQSLAGQTVILDAGHGGKDPGASHFGLNEKDINLDLARRTASILRARGINVVMTRSTDDFISLPERSAIANRTPNATLVSIHVNAAPGYPTSTGVETFILSGEFTDAERSRIASERFKANGSSSPESKAALATLCVQARNRGPALAEALSRTLSSRTGEPNRGVKQKNLAVLRETYFGPAVLVEVGFLTNRRSAERMRTDDWRRRTADALADGICEFLRLPIC